MDELRIAREKIKELEERQKKDEKTVKSQFEHMMKLQEKCKELKSTIAGVPSSKSSKPSVIPGLEDKDKTIDDLKDKLLQAEKDKEILKKAQESEVKSGRLLRGKLEA
jgi:hypothetical protein